MKQFYRRGLFLLLLLPMVAVAQQDIPAPTYVPPDRAVAGEEAYHKDLAVIEMSCASYDEARALWVELTRSGALVSVIASPRRMMAWVPAEALAAVRSLRLDNARGNARVLSVSYTAAEARSALQKVSVADPVERETEEALLDYLEFIRLPKTDADRQREQERELEIQLLQQVKPVPDCVTEQHVDADWRPDGDAQNLLGGPGPSITRSTRVQGLVVHNSFFPESQTGSGSWNWDNTIYNRYRNFYVAAINYWASFAAKYGRTMTGIWRLFGPSHSAVQINGEPTVVGENSFVPVIIDRLSTGTPPTWNNINIASRWCWMYNNEMRAAYSADESICGFIAWKPSGDEGIWPHANSIIWNNGDREGVYFAMDTQYWQAELDPFAAPRRNVVAHEIGHLWGAPDEYANDAGCFNWTYRGIGNINCQRNQPAMGRPGLTMTGYDGIMGWNYTSGNSVATPIHTGIRSAANVSPVRCFSTVPANIPITVKNCDDNGRTYNTTMCIPMDFDYCQKTFVPATRLISGVTYYFDKWRVRRRSGATSDITWVANEIISWQFTSTLADPVVDVIALFTNTPPDFNTANTTVEAMLAPAGQSATPNRAIALRWRNKYDMSRVVTRVEYERTAGNWVEMTSGMTLGAFAVGINQWTGVHIFGVPTAGGGTTPLAANTQYRFRIVGYFNGVRGAVSNVAQITTRPATPNDTVYCYDAYEPNSIGSARTLTSSGPGMEPYAIKAACPITGVSGEFSWFHPKNDYYRITVIGLTDAAYGDNLTITVSVRPASDFRPRLRAQRVGETTHINAITVNDTTWRLSLTADGEYLIKVEPQISQYVSNDLVDRTGGHFGFGEYILGVSRGQNRPSLLCPQCVKLVMMKPLPGIFVMEPPFRIFNPGLPVSPGGSFGVRFQPPPGFLLDGFDGGFGRGTQNPFTIGITPNTKPGEYELWPIVRRITKDLAELVIVHPEGPGGPLDERITRTVGTLVNATATAPTGFEFVGWGGDTTATTNPLPVVLWKSKRVIAYFRQKPCVPEPMSKWLHRISLVNARQGSVTLDYGMDVGAGDGLEAGQPDLPPIPPPGTFDVRWTNIPGSQGSTVDLRAIQQSFTYQMRVQTGSGTTPVNMSWGVPPTTPNASYTMRISGVPGSIDMRTTTSYAFTLEGSYVVTIEVKAPACPPPTKPPEVDITTVRVVPDGFPCILVELKVRSRSTGDLLPYYDPYKLKVFERNSSGDALPARLTDILQQDSTVILRICSDREDDSPTREIVVINDNDDPDTQKDTTDVTVTVPVPPGQGKLARVVRQNSGDWEMVSLPLDVAASLTTELYADPSTRLYLFNTTAGAYASADSMDFGRGYWLKTDDRSTTFIGYERNLFTFSGLSGVGEPYGYGWNMIGGISKPLAVSAIQQTPTGGLRAIFGWNPASGYVIPTQINPGFGYWVRVNPGTTLKMEVSGVTGHTQTAYQRRMQTLPLAGRLVMETPDGNLRSIDLSRQELTTEDVEMLQVPQRPPEDAADIRTEEGTLVAGPGTAILAVQASADVRLRFEPQPGAVEECVLLSASGEELAVFDGERGGEVIVPVYGRTTVLLRTRVHAPLASATDLGQNYPNPFREAGETVIPYRIEDGAVSRIVITDVLGRVVRTLPVESLAANGNRFIVWNGRDDDGRPLSAGVYVYRLESGSTVRTRTLSIVK